MQGINPYKISILYDRVLIKLPKPVNDEIVFDSGVKLIIDTTWEPASHTQVHGEVVRVCNKFTFGKDNPFSKDWLPKVEVQPGDHVILDYFQILNNMGKLVHRYAEHQTDLYIEWDGEYFVFVDYHELWAKKMDTYLQPLNGYIIYKGVQKKTTFGVYTTEALNTSEGIAVAVGENNIAYKESIYQDVDGVYPGDRIYFKRDMYRKLEYDSHAKENKNLYLVQKRYVMGVKHAE